MSQSHHCIHLGRFNTYVNPDKKPPNFSLCIEDSRAATRTIHPRTGGFVDGRSSRKAFKEPSSPCSTAVILAVFNTSEYSTSGMPSCPFLSASDDFDTMAGTMLSMSAMKTVHWVSFQKVREGGSGTPGESGAFKASGDAVARSILVVSGSGLLSLAPGSAEQAVCFSWG